jgi:hypothetical protein
MARSRSIFAGGTDYTGVDLVDIVEHMRDWHRTTVATIDLLGKSRLKVQSGRFEDADEIVSFIDHRLDVFRRYEGDLHTLVEELPKGVEARHLEMAQQIVDSASFQERLCVDFKRDHLAKPLDADVRWVLDDVYAESRQQLIEFQDLGNAIRRLRTYVGSGPTKGSDVVELKPNCFGLGVDLRALWRRTRPGRLWARIARRGGSRSN